MAGAQPEEIVPRALVMQRWRDVAFLHWRVEAEHLAPHLPADLEPDVVDGSCWVGLTPFSVEGFRPLGLPAVPRLSTYSETNLRTYVRHRDGRDGLWFLSLDVDSLTSTVGGRALGVPYHLAEMCVHQQSSDRWRYRCRRRMGGCGHDIEVTPGGSATSDQTAALLAGRWRAFIQSPAGLVAVAVEHEPWPLQHASLVRFEETLVEAAGLPRPSAPALVHWSEGVDARLGSPRAA